MSMQQLMTVCPVTISPIQFTTVEQIQAELARIQAENDRAKQSYIDLAVKYGK